MKNPKSFFWFLSLLKPKFWIFLCFYAKGLFFMINQKYHKAIEMFKKCLDFDPSMISLGLVYEQLGKCYTDIGELDKGKGCLLKSLEIDSKQAKLNSEVSSRLGYIYFQEGDYEKAKYHLENAIKSYGKLHYTDINYTKRLLKEVKERIESCKRDGCI